MAIFSPNDPIFCGGFSFAEGNLMKMTQKQIWFSPEGIIYTMMRLSSNYPYQQRIKLDTNGALKFTCDLTTIGDE